MKRVALPLLLLGLMAGGNAAFGATDCARVGDVVIYRAADMTGQFMISHSATVASMEGCTLRKVSIYLQGDQGATWCKGGRAPGTAVLADPDAPELASSVGGERDWVVLHSDRQAGNRLTKLRNIRIGKARTLVSAYVTDKGKLIFGVPQQKASNDGAGTPINCHGFTFTQGESAIVGWSAGGRKHLDGASNDQARAVQIILDDNGYRKVHALDRHGVDHF